MDGDDAMEDKMKSAFDKIAVGLGEAIAYANGDTSRGRVAGVNVKDVRAKTKMSQTKFADTYRLPIGTLRDWEQARRAPDSGSSIYLRMIDADPDGVQELLAKVAA